MISISISSTVFYTGVKIPLYLLWLYVNTFVAYFMVLLSLAWYDPFMGLLEEGPWYDWLIYFSASLFVIPGVVVVITTATYSVYIDFIAFLFDAWKDFTIDVEPVNSPV